MAVCACSDFIDNCWFKIDEDSTWDVLASASLGEEGVEGIIADTDGLVGWHLAVWLDAVLEAVEFPATVTDLDTSLTDVD